MTAAGWLIGTEDGQWFFHIATPLVDDEGATKAGYRRVNAVIRQMQHPFWINPLEVKLIGPNNPIAQDMLAVYRRHPGPSPIRYGGNQLGGVNIEAAYLYPIPAHTSAQ